MSFSLYWLSQWKEHRKRIRALEAERNRLLKALEFYADPDTYFAVGLFGDAPCGDFVTDFSDTPRGLKPGKRAREALGVVLGIEL